MCTRSCIVGAARRVAARRLRVLLRLGHQARLGTGGETEVGGLIHWVASDQRQCREQARSASPAAASSTITASAPTQISAQALRLLLLQPHTPW